MNKLVLALVILVLPLGVVTYLYRTELVFIYHYAGSKPEVPVEEAIPPPKPDYSKPEHWAALPQRTDSADIAPPSIDAGDQMTKPADVFFIHPTTHRDNTWNAPMDHSKTNTRTDNGTIRLQASAFNGCCRIYAPRYRQACLFAFISEPDNEVRATAIAYADVVQAFEYYIEHYNDGRPFLLASHSQGSRYALWLLEDRIENTELEEQLVAAYIVGYAIPRDWFERRLKRIGPCSRADDTGCVLTWSTYAEGVTPSRSQKVRHRFGLEWEANGAKPLVCTNPLSWAEASAPASANLGAWISPLGADALWPLQPCLTGARCENGALYITPPDEGIWKRAVLPGNNFHNYDYQLFYMNIRQNAADRVNAFLTARAAE